MVIIPTGVRPGRESKKKKYNQDRTIKKSQKRNISHIWGQAPRKAIAIKFGTWVDVHGVVTWAKFDFFKFKGCKFYRG